MDFVDRLWAAMDSKTARASELYRIIVGYSKIESGNELSRIAKNDADFDNLLEYLSILFDAQNCAYYNSAYIGLNVNAPAPDYLPHDNTQLYAVCLRLIYGMMAFALEGNSKYLSFPDFADMEKRIDSLCLEECMQYLLFYSRGTLSNEEWFGKWQEGTVLAVVTRMRKLRKNGNNQEERFGSLEYIMKYAGINPERKTGARSSRHDVSLKKWRLRIQLDDEAIWFLSVFVKDDGSFDKYSLDRETASDSHYEFSDENGLRKRIYQPGDEDRTFDEVLINYVRGFDGYGLLSALTPFITAQFHYD